MAAKNGNGKDKKVVFKGFVPLSLNQQEKQHVKDNPLDSEALQEFILNAAFHGYKFSLSWSRNQDCYTATLYGNRWGQPNAGYAMSIRHADAVTAITGLSWIMAENGYDSDWGVTFGLHDDVNW